MKNIDLITKGLFDGLPVSDYLVIELTNHEENSIHNICYQKLATQDMLMAFSSPMNVEVSDSPFFMGKFLTAHQWCVETKSEMLWRYNQCEITRIFHTDFDPRLAIEPLNKWAIDLGESAALKSGIKITAFGVGCTVLYDALNKAFKKFFGDDHFHAAVPDYLQVFYKWFVSSNAANLHPFVSPDSTIPTPKIIAKSDPDVCINAMFQVWTEFVNKGYIKL